MEYKRYFTFIRHCEVGMILIGATMPGKNECCYDLCFFAYSPYSWCTS